MFLTRFRVLAIGLLLLGLFIVTNEASALTLSPTRFELSGAPGQTLTGEIKLINETNKAENYYISYSNFEAQGESGTPNFVEPDGGIGTWIHTDQEFYTVVPGKQELVPFKIQIPKDAEPGGHFGVVFFGTSPRDGSQVSIGSQTGVLILLSVAGEVREDAGLLDFTTKDKKFWYKTLPVNLEYRFKNDGGDRVKPVGRINIRNTFFIRTEKLDANPVEGNVLPGSTRKYKVDWVNYERPIDYVSPDGFFAKYFDNVSYQWKNFALGLYSANLKIEYGSLPFHAKETVFFFVFPWELTIVLVLVLGIIYFGGRILIKRYNRYIIDQAQKRSSKGSDNV